MNLKGEQEIPKTPKRESKAFSSDSIDVAPPENSYKQGSPATVDSPMRAELFQGSHEAFHLPDTSPSPSRSAEHFREKLHRDTKSREREDALISAFAKAVEGKKNKENGSLEAKDTDRAGSGKGLSKSPFQLSSPPSTSAFQFVKTNDCGIAYLRSKICQSAQSTFQDSPRAMSPIPALRPIVQLPPSKQRGKRCTILAGLDAEHETQPSAYSVIKISSLKVQGKREGPEPDMMEPEELMVEDCRNGEVFQCKHCGKCFGTGQALGGHMSRKHSGKSTKYNYKKDVRKKREFERMKLYMAKKKYFESLGYNYEHMVQTPEGKMKAKSLINRSRIKKIKSILADEEVYNYFEGPQQ